MIAYRTPAIKTGLIFAVSAVSIFVGAQDPIQIFLRIGAINNMFVWMLVILSGACRVNFMC